VRAEQFMPLHISQHPVAASSIDIVAEDPQAAAACYLRLHRLQPSLLP
jgi:hypothetical protein